MMRRRCQESGGNGAKPRSHERISELSHKANQLSCVIVVGHRSKTRENAEGVDRPQSSDFEWFSSGAIQRKS